MCKTPVVLLPVREFLYEAYQKINMEVFCFLIWSDQCKLQKAKGFRTHVISYVCKKNDDFMPKISLQAN